MVDKTTDPGLNSYVYALVGLHNTKVCLFVAMATNYNVSKYTYALSKQL